MTDIVERLRSKATDCHESEEPLYLEAAAEIGQLRDDLALRNQTALDRKEIIAKLEVEIERLRMIERLFQERKVSA